MQQNLESNALAAVFQSTRELTRFYISKLKDTDPFHEFSVNDIKLNSAYWIVNHLIWAENYLLLESLEGPKMDLPWLNDFGFGSQIIVNKDMQPLKEVLNVMKQVHQLSINHIKTISADELEKPNAIGFGFGGENSKRMMIHHAIRHESLHTGHLSWICKLNGIKTV